MQPAPNPGTEDVLPYVLDKLNWVSRLKAGQLLISQLIARAEHGLKKYGTKLQANNGRDAMVDAFEEAQDAVMYLGQKHLEKPGDVRVHHLQWLAEDLALGIASYINTREKPGV